MESRSGRYVVCSASRTVAARVLASALSLSRTMSTRRAASAAAIVPAASRRRGRPTQARWPPGGDALAQTLGRGVKSTDRHVVRRDRIKQPPQILVIFDRGADQQARVAALPEGAGHVLEVVERRVIVGPRVHQR